MLNMHRPAALVFQIFMNYFKIIQKEMLEFLLFSDSTLIYWPWTTKKEVGTWRQPWNQYRLVTDNQFL